MTGFSPTRMIGGRYVVLGDIDGTVRRASDRVTGLQVAVEELRLPHDPGERTLAREQLLRVARAAGRLDHPGFVTIHDVVTDGDADHIVTELVDAPTLAERVAADGPLDEREATAMTRQLASALQAAHGAGIVHGDISPHTVRLGPDGKVRLAGVGKAVDPQRAARDPGFLAPELRDGGQPTPESDLWAFGAALHVAVLARPPTDGAVPVFGGGALGSVLAGLLQRVPRDRPSARQVVGALDDAHRLARASRRRGRRWWWAVAGAALGLLLGLAAGFVLATPRVEALTYGPDGDVRLDGPVAGACLAAAPATGVVLDAVDCAGPHGAEVVATLDPFGGRDVPYPGQEAFSRFAAGACTPVFDAVVEPSGLELVALVPARAGFATGQREVHCVVRATDGSALDGGRVAGKRG
ncbi:serine/threonine-protein kinase [Pseudonocardia adelaidensis]|uniref:non-specific serine/threonine protein kinase n=1 Tax=Pseudonocardia adelaidensis TaxID=648754 RepID=A0ABP9N9L3_9PSEU